MRKTNEIDLIFDFDGVICENHNGSYHDAPPKPHSIEQINRAYDKGYNITIFTARYGKRHPGHQYEHGYEEALKWLRDNGVKFHVLRMAKPAGDIYVDDKACLIEKDEDWGTNFWPQVHELKHKDKYNQTARGASDTLIKKPYVEALEYKAGQQRKFDPIPFVLVVGTIGSVIIIAIQEYFF